MPVIEKAQTISISDDDGYYVDEASEQDMETTPKGMVLPDLPIFAAAPKKAAIKPWMIAVAVLGFLFLRKK